MAFLDLFVPWARPGWIDSLVESNLPNNNNNKKQDEIRLLSITTETKRITNSALRSDLSILSVFHDCLLILNEVHLMCKLDWA